MDEISNKHKRFNSLSKQLTNETDAVKSDVTWIKSIVLATALTLL